MCISVLGATGTTKAPTSNLPCSKPLKTTLFNVIVSNGVGLLIAAMIVRYPCSDSFSEVTSDVTILIGGIIAWFYLGKTRGSKAPKKVAPGAAMTHADTCRRSIQSPMKPMKPVKPVKREGPVPRRPRETVSFLAGGWDAEVVELLRRISPTPACEVVAGQLGAPAREFIKAIVPEAVVDCFANVRLVGNTDCGSLEADLAITVPHHVLAQRLETHSLTRVQGLKQQFTRKSLLDLAYDELVKAALQMFTKVLTKGSYAGESFYHFHHCSYRGDEPKVVLRVPSKLGLSDRDIFVTVFVNCPTPCNAAALMAQCRRYDKKAAELAQLARRWARDRGIAFAAKGHLSPYTWTVLSTFFLQHHAAEKANGSPQLPLFGGCDRSPVDANKVDDVESAIKDESVASLFQAFLRFYGQDLEWNAGTISVRTGSLEERRDTSTLISVEDPFDSSRELGATISDVGLMRLREELRRANMLLDTEGSGLKELLEPWLPEGELREVTN